MAVTQCDVSHPRAADSRDVQRTARFAEAVGGHDESASGNTADACRTNVANKLGELSMSQAGASILTQAKNRTTYGNEFTILVKSPSGYVSDNLADELYLALESIDGATRSTNHG